MDNNEKVTLHKRTILYIFAALTILFTTTGYFYYQNQKTLLKAQMYNELSGIAKIKIADINHWLDDRRSDALLLFNNRHFINDLEKYISGPSEEANTEALNSWFKIINDDKQYRNIIIIDPKGKIIFSQHTPRIPLFNDTFDEAKAAISGNKIIMSGLKLDKITNVVYMQTFIPILSDINGVTKEIGIVVLRIDPQVSFYPVIQSWLLPTKTAESLVIRLENDSVLFLSNLKYKKDSAMRFKLPLNLKDFPPEYAAQGNEGIFEGKDYRRVPVLTDIRKIQNTNWWLITKIDQSEIYAPIVKEAWLVFIIIFFLVIVSAVILYLLWNTQKQYFNKKHYSALLEKQRLREQINIIIQNANDIFILLDTNNKIIEINEAAIKTYGYTREEFLKLKGKDLRDPQSKSKFNEDIQRLEREKQILIETYHVRKNGEVFPVEVGLALIELGSEKVIQGIIRDITERRTFEKNLVKMNRVYSVLSNTNQLIVREKDRQKLFNEICKIAVEDGHFRLVWIGITDENNKVNVTASYGSNKNYLENLSINLNDKQRGGGPTGRCIKSGAHTICNDILTDETMKPWREAAINNNFLSSAGFPLKIFNKTIGAITFYSGEKNFFNDDEIRLIDEMALDISFALEFLENEEERQRTEEILIENEKKLSTIYSNVSDILFLLSVENDSNYRFVSVNDTFSKTVGIAKNFIVGKLVREIIPEPSLTEVLSYYERAIKEKQTVKWEEATQYPAGLKYGEVSVTPIFNAKGLCTNLIGAVHDITETKMAQEEIIRSKQLYQSFFEDDLTGDCIVLPSGKIITCNPSFLEMFGFSTVEEALKYNMYDLYPTSNKREEMLDKLRISKRLENYEIEMRTKGGAQIFVIENVIGSFDKEDNLTEIKGYIINITARKLAENQLRKLSVAIEQSPVSIVITDTTGNIEYVNPKFVEVTGYSFEEVRGNNPRILKSGRQSVELYKTLWDTIKSGKVWTGELMNKKKDGSFYWEYVAISSIQDSDGKIINFLAVKEDITQRKLSAEIINKSENQFRSVWNNSADGMRLTNPEGVMILVNDAFCNMVGMQKVQLEGKPLGVIYKKENQEHVVQKHKERFAAKTVAWHFEREMELWNYKKKWFEVTNSFIELGEKDTLLLGIFRDITNRKQAEGKIKLLAHAVEGVSECVSITDQQDNILFINKSFIDKYGYKEEELIGKNISIVRSKDLSTKTVKEIMPKTIQGGWRGELMNRRKDGTEFPISLSTSVIKDENKNPIALIGVAIDITEEKHKREELIAAKEKAEEMNKLKTNFLANMSHELRTPMIGILGYSEMLKDEINDEAQKDMADTIYISGKRLLETLNHLLDMAKLESSKSEIILSDLNVGGIVKTSIKNFEGFAASKKLYLNSNIKDYVYSNLDKRLLIQILDNLINNALKYTERGGVTVEVYSEEIDNKNWSVIKVIDTGIGIPKNSLDIIFEEFRQVSEGYNRQFEGTGLGLTITKRSVELMKGTISVESELGSGSKFTVKFPQIQSTESKEVHQDEKQILISNKKNPSIKILVVDNDKITFEYVQLILKKYYEIHFAENGEYAIRLVSENSYKIILMDIGLGIGKNGIETSQEIRKIPGYENTPIVAVTAFAMKEDKATFLSNGLNYYISKPFSRFELLSLINEILSAQKKNV